MIGIAFSSLAQKTIEAKSAITEVSVFLAGAIVTRTTTVDLKAGGNEVRLASIASRMDPNSIQVGGSGDILITGVRQEVDWSLLNIVSNLSDPNILIKSSCKDSRNLELPGSPCLPVLPLS